MFFNESNFVMFIIFYFLYYSNYIAVYIIIYLLFKKNDRFKKFIHFFWNQYHEEQEYYKSIANKKKFLLQESIISFNDQSNKHKILLTTFAHIIEKKKIGNIDIMFNNYKKSYSTYIENCHKKIIIHLTQEKVIQYTKEILLHDTSAYDDFVFLEKLEHIRKEKNE